MESITLTPIEVKRGYVHLWCWDLLCCQSQLQQFVSLLSHNEMRWLTRLRFDQDKKRFAISRGAVRAILAQYVGRDPMQLEFYRSYNGKPYLLCSDKTLEFNFSRTTSLAVLAVTSGNALGVDVEEISPDHIPSMARAFSMKEIRGLQQMGEVERITAIFRGWVRKEALLKAEGLGLAAPMDALEVALTPNYFSSAGLIDDRILKNSWTLIDIPVGPQFSGAVAIGDQHAVIEYRSFRGLAPSTKCPSEWLANFVGPPKLLNFF